MAKQTSVNYAFNRGLVSPIAQARVDADAMQFSADVLTNWDLRDLGPMSLRPGFEYLLNTGENHPRYLSFVFAINDTGLLELTDGELRPLVDDAALTFGAVTAAITNGDMEPNLNDWTDADDSGATSEYAATAGSVVQLSDLTVYDAKVADDATSKYKADADGTIYTMRNYYDSGAYVAGDVWKLSGAVADYEHRFTVISGTLTSGTTNTWLGGGTDRELVKTTTVDGTYEVVVLHEIKLAAGTDAIAQATITLKVTRQAAIGGGGGGIEP
jgi:hypothetical protein